MPNILPQIILDEIKRRGYKLEISDDGNTHKLIRPDGTVAVIATKDEKKYAQTLRPRS